MSLYLIYQSPIVEIMVHALCLRDVHVRTKQLNFISIKVTYRIVVFSLFYTSDFL